MQITKVRRFMAVLLTLALSLALLSLAATPAHAADVGNYAALQSECAVTGVYPTVALSADITDDASMLTIGRDLTLDLNGHDLTIEVPTDNGIKINSGFTLTIMDGAGGGTLTVTNTLTTQTDNMGAAINTSEGMLIIESGVVTATGGICGAGIGGGRAQGGGTIAIGGDAVVTSTGGQYAAGIGGGNCYYSAGTPGSITIGGDAVITATGGQHGAGIGGGRKLDGGTIAIKDSADVTAKGGTWGAGVGGGAYSNGGAISIEGGTVKAYGGISGGAGIGGGGNNNSTNAAFSSGSGGTIVISGGTIVALGGDNGGNNCGGGAGIGGGGGTSTKDGGSSGDITISGDANVTAKGGDVVYSSSTGNLGGGGGSGIGGGGGGGSSISTGLPEGNGGDIDNLDIDTTGNLIISATGGSSELGKGAGIGSGSGVAGAGTESVVGSNTVAITTQPAAETTVIQGSITGSLGVAATVSESWSVLNYQWYSNTTGTNSGGAVLDINTYPTATASSLTIPADLTVGTYFYYCVVGAPGAVSETSDVAVVTVENAPGAAITMAAVEASKTDSSITVAAAVVAANPGAQDIEYLINTNGTDHTAGNPTIWQSGLTFSGLSASTTYYVWARTAAKTGYDAGIPVASAAITTTASAGGGGVGGGGASPSSNPNNAFEGGSGGGAYIIGSGENLVHITQKDFSQHNGIVKVNGSTLIHGTHYKAESGSTKITLYADYLDTLPVGEHTLSVGFKDGTTATAKFNIAEGNADKPIPEPWINPFADVESSDWFFGDVEYVFSNGLMEGTSTDPMLFSPDLALTREMVATVLYRMAGTPDAHGLANPFDDVAEGTWYGDAVIWAAANGIVSGYGNGKFGTGDNITREQMAVMIYNYQQFSGKIPTDTAADREFDDRDEISGWAKDAVNRLTVQSIINGKPGNLFDPQGEATRAEFAVILHRLDA